MIQNEKSPQLDLENIDLENMDLFFFHRHARTEFLLRKFILFGFFPIIVKFQEILFNFLEV